MEFHWSVSVIMLTFIYTAAGQKNLTPEGQARQSTGYSIYSADRALSPPASTNWSSGCSHTGQGEKKSAWWSLNFNESLFITTVILYYRDTFPERVNGFSLYVTNGTKGNVPDNGPVGFLCYKDPDTLQNQTFIFNIDCNTVGKKVVFYNTKNIHNNEIFVELCYVEVHGCPLTKYGINCSMSCPEKCIDQQCFPASGSCVLGCGSGFCLNNSCSNDGTCNIGCTNGKNGKYCDNKYKNLALNRPAVQGDPSTIIPLSVDGNRVLTSCTTFTASNAWIEVDIGFYGIITAVYLNIIDTSSNQEKMYSIYCTNVSNSNEILLHNGQLPSHDIAVDQTICRYVRILPPKSALQICEIEVIGCHSGWYGKYCNMSCPEKCGGPCDLDSGICSYGCKDGYSGTKCEKKCENGKYGSQCLQACSANCNSPPCDHVTGICVNGGCKPGWIGDNCTKACSSGKYGINCSESCIGCVGNLCDNEDGLCDNKTVCKPGWAFGPKCKEACNDTYHGLNCQDRCYCLGGPCNKSTGNCKAGCEKGFEGTSCSKECNAGYFGENCNDTCEGCVADMCDRWEGICANGTQCKPGWKYNQKCNNKCNSGTYGSNCSESCNGCVDDLCDHVDGFCIIAERCKPGWKTGPKCDESNMIGDINEDDPDSTVAMGAGAGVSLFLLLVIILGTLIYVKRRRIGGRKESVLKYRKAQQTHSLNTNLQKSKGISNRGVALSSELIYDEDEEDMPRDNNECVYNNIVLNQDSNQYKIPVENLMKAIVDKHNTEGFKIEYEALLKGCVFEHENGKKPENKTKNRFRTTFPYDHSRVILKGDTLHDYINASHIDNYQKKKAYIASQGPKGNTLRDFWHMIWQEKVGKIVMVTRLIEEKGKKCEQYWPESTSEGLALENYNLSMTKEVEHSIYVYREIKVFNTTTKEERTVKQFHFTQWPDHGVPDKIKLVNFYRKVKVGRTDLQGPMIVHCSAGIGRTGTFIALDALYENGKITGFVDVMDYVKMMRKDRMNMIQTVDQYIAVYEALLELFSVPDTSIPKTEFCEYIEKHFKQTVPKNQTNLRQEFQRLQGLRPVFKDEDFSVGKASENQKKNSVNNILPHNDYRPYLTSYDASGNDYINAIIIPGYSVKSKFIVTQFPLKDTVVDFWTMVYQHGSSIVVLLDSFDKTTALWGDGKRDFKKLRVRKTQDHSEDEIEILLAQQNDTRTITVLKTIEWKGEQNALPSPQIILRLLKRISRHQSNKQGPVVILCRDGCTRSGLALALSLVIEKMTMDDEVDIFQVVRTMQTRRPEFLSNFDQYEYCYRCIKEYLEEDSLYMNVELAK